MIRLVMSSAAIIAFVSAASAATLSDVSGSVLVDSGKGFRKVSAASDVAVGSRVMVTRGGKAVLAYADGCKKTLAANSITTVVKSDACKQTTQVAAQSGGDTVFRSGFGVVGGVSSGRSGRLNLTTVLTGGVIVGAIAVPFINNDKDRPLIPISQ
ncbi:hypothetical protein OSH08_17300 [Kaistia geumhonensis]|uniref:Uncharacterized protein n=1 Tax=Kaistia geumhonensis TaxID=410839 RepID=A0ABU0M984_9HYPH|nr:hypothetical protein [Kaistia geumhonensis]MCX5480759.1 hypothetical protein [Kaistia geumhonensis]MDQ0517537.1 hypothetical protein [Kaistia geumhonensis]